MADSLLQIFGTERDKVNCPFYFKIGACRHGDKCSRIHHRPTSSPTLLIQHMYPNPYAGLSPEAIAAIDPAEVQLKFEDFFEVRCFCCFWLLLFCSPRTHHHKKDVLEEMQKFGAVEELHVCDNLCDHMVGNVYVKFASEDSAARALTALTGRFYAGRPVLPEFSPVTEFREARCRQYDMGECNRGGFCNFMHLKKISPELERELFKGKASAAVSSMIPPPLPPQSSSEHKKHHSSSSHRHHHRGHHSHHRHHHRSSGSHHRHSHSKSKHRHGSKSSSGSSDGGSASSSGSASSGSSRSRSPTAEFFS